MFFIDLNAPKGHTSAIPQKEMTYEFRENDFCPTHGLSTGLRIPSMCPTIPRSLQDEKFFMLGSVSLHGLRTAHVSRKFERYRGLPSLGPTETLPHGYPGQSLPQYSGPCQPGERLANLCRLCPDSYWPRPTSLCQRFLWCGVESNGLCLGLHPHRFVSVAFPLGQVSEAQRSRKITHPPGSARKHSLPCHYYPWEDSRCDHPRSTDLRTGSPLHRGSGISRFRSSLWDPSILGIFCDQSEKQFQVPTVSILAPSTNPVAFNATKSLSSRVLRPKRLPRKIATDSLLRYQPKQTPGFLNQQLYASRLDHRPTLSVSAGRSNSSSNGSSSIFESKPFMEQPRTPSKLRSGLPSRFMCWWHIVKKHLNLEQSLYTILQILSVTLFEKTLILEALSKRSTL